MEPKEPRKIILPLESGVPNLEIKRMQRQIEQEKARAGIHPDTSQEVANLLDTLRQLTDQERVRAMLAVAVVQPKTPQDQEALTILASPRDVTLVETVAQLAAHHLSEVLSSLR